VRAARGITAVDSCSDTAALLAPTELPADPAERAAVAEVRTQVARAKALGLAGRRAEAIAAAEAAVAAPIRFRPARAEALAELGGHYKKVGKAAEAAATLDRALVEAVAATHPLASLSAAEGRFWVEADLTQNLPAARFWLDYGRAASSALGPDPARDALLGYQEAALQRRQGDRTAALQTLASIQDTAEREPAARSLLPYILWMRADVLVALGRLREARPIQERGLEIDERDLGPDHPDIAFDLQVLARIDTAADAFARAEGDLRRALAVASKALGPGDVFVSDLHLDLARLLVAASRPREALAEIDRAIAINHALMGAANASLPPILLTQGDALRDLGRSGEAKVVHERALGLLPPSYRADHPERARLAAALGRDLLALGQPRRAAALLEPAVAALARQGDSLELAALRFELGRALWSEPGARRRAQELVETARARLAAEGGHPAALQRAIEAWLAAGRA
jgi:tetratricopeptide (TPR) repeat protein